MKVRLDFISNSSSSSFLVIGSQYFPNDGHTLTIEDFDNLEEDERLFVVEPNGVLDCDFVVPVTPDILMDLDLNGTPISLDTETGRFTLFKIRKYSLDFADGHDIVRDAAEWNDRYSGMFGYTTERISDIYDVPIRKGERVIKLEVDDHTPTSEKDVIDWFRRMHSERKTT